MIQRWTTDRNRWRGYQMINIDGYIYDDDQAEEHTDVQRGLWDGL